MGGPGDGAVPAPAGLVLPADLLRPPRHRRVRPPPRAHAATLGGLCRRGDHDDLAGRLVEQWGGRVVKTTGDGLLATFDGPGRAIGCAVALRDQLGDIDLQIRAGLHAGEVEVRDDDVGGIAVHIAARILAEARPGEVVVSRTVRDLVAGSDRALADRGTRRLKGVDGDWQLFAVADG